MHLKYSQTVEQLVKEGIYFLVIALARYYTEVSSRSHASVRGREQQAREFRESPDRPETPQWQRAASSGNQSSNRGEVLAYVVG